MRGRGTVSPAFSVVLAGGGASHKAIVELQLLVDQFLVEVKAAKGDPAARSFVASVIGDVPDHLKPALAYLMHEAAGISGPAPTTRKLGEDRGFVEYGAEVSGATQIFDCAAIVAHAVHRRNKRSAA